MNIKKDVKLPKLKEFKEQNLTIKPTIVKNTNFDYQNPTLAKTKIKLNNGFFR